MAVNKAQFDLRSKGIDPNATRDGKNVFKRDIVQNPDGTFTAKIAPDRGESPMEESYTLEEWMGMMEEAGYDINELSPETLASYNAKATKDLETHDNIMQRNPSNFERKARNRHKGIQAARGVLRAQGMPTEPKVEESTIAENAVSRLQQLAGIKPLNG